MYVHLMSQAMEPVELGALMSRDFISKYPTEWQEADGDPGYRMFGGKKIFFLKQKINLTTNTLKIVNSFQFYDLKCFDGES